MRSALLVIDFQHHLIDHDPRPADAGAVRDRVNAVAARAREANVPVVFVQHESEGGALAYGSEGWRLADGLVARDGDHHVRKTTPDAFLRTTLAELLDGLGAEHLLICGYASEFCVDTTVRRAAALGYLVTLVADAHTTHDKPHASGAQIRAHENATLPAITSFGKTIVAVPADEVVFG